MANILHRAPGILLFTDRMTEGHVFTLGPRSVSNGKTADRTAILLTEYYYIETANVYRPGDTDRRTACTDRALNNNDRRLTESIYIKGVASCLS
jgi:hypothetical protein